MTRQRWHRFVVYSFSASLKIDSFSTWEAEIGRSLWVRGQPGQQSEFEASLVNRVSSRTSRLVTQRNPVSKSKKKNKQTKRKKNWQFHEIKYQNSQSFIFCSILHSVFPLWLLNIRTHTHTHMHTHRHIHPHVHKLTHMHTQTYTDTCTYTYMYTSIRIYTHKNIPKPTCTYVYVCTPTGMYVYTCLHIYITVYANN